MTQPSPPTVSPHRAGVIGNTILMGDGSYFDYAAPNAAPMTIEDYAWALAGNARFRGQTRRAPLYRPGHPVDQPGPRALYSVCQHVVLLTRALIDDDYPPEACFSEMSCTIPSTCGIRQRDLYAKVGIASECAMSRF